MQRLEVNGAVRPPIGVVRLQRVNLSQECWNPGLEENLVPVHCQIARRRGLVVWSVTPGDWSWSRQQVTLKRRLTLHRRQNAVRHVAIYQV